MNFKEMYERLSRKLAQNLDQIDHYGPLIEKVASKIDPEDRKEATADSTATLVEWAIKRGEVLHEEDIVRFFKSTYNWDPTFKDDKSDLRWERGQELVFDFDNCKDDVNRNVIRQFDGKTARVEATEKQDGSLVNDRGDNAIIVSVGGEPVEVPHGQRKKNSGLLTPDPGFGGAKLEVVYFSSGDNPPTPEREKAVRQYMDKDRNRSSNYYTGTPTTGPTEHDKDGTIYFRLSGDQRPYPVTLNVSKGTILYVGRLPSGRPKGMEQDIERWTRDE
jgi:hypothetical protein